VGRNGGEDAETLIRREGVNGWPEDCIKATAGDYHTQFWSIVPEWER
jgi:hypothetical protein